MLPHVAFLLDEERFTKAMDCSEEEKSVNQITKAFYHDCIGRHRFRASGDEMK